MVSLTVRWGGQDLSLPPLALGARVGDVKIALEEMTGVRVDKQKLLGLKSRGGEPADDETTLGDLKLRPNSKLMMVGSREETLLQAQEFTEDSSVVNDLDLEEEEEEELMNREENVRKVSRRVSAHHLTVLNEPRLSKKLLVLDIDYTLFDHKSCAETGLELMRPFLHEFLTDAYLYYDIVIWSATNMKWIEVKMKELGVTSNPNYKITFMLDSSAMISVYTPKYGVVEVKPLAVIWGKFPVHYGPGNTIMLDDIRHNFLMNPQNGLKVRPFCRAHSARATDRELIKLGRYLRQIAALADLSSLNHRHWERYSAKKEEGTE